MERTVLYDRHEALGAKFSDFAGWAMPLEYAGVVAEHNAVRSSVGVFDVSHLGKVLVKGPGAAEFINRCFTNDLDRIEPGKAQYTLCCDPDTGGVIDDLIAYLRGPDEVFLIPNAANTAAVVERLNAARPEQVEVIDQHRDWAVLAVQGTRSDEVLEAIGLPTGHDYMSFVDVDIDGSAAVVCRTGYTGERGYEIVVESAGAVAVWDRLLEAGAEWDIAPCGLGARDTLRTEMGYPLHGQDLSAQITPVQAGIGWAVGWGKESFWGDAVLREQKANGTPTKLRGLVASGRGIPRPGMSVRLTRDLPIGEVTSGTFSPTARKGIGLAMLATQVEDGAEVLVDIRGRAEVFVVTKPPFVESGVRES